MYYDPEKDGGSSQEVYYDDKTSDNESSDVAPSTERRSNQNDRPDNSSGYANDDYDEYDDYDYYYSSRIKRFNRPYQGFGYFDDCYVGMYNYDPFWSGTTIYVGFDSYRDYRRWRRWNNFNYCNSWGPTYSWGWGYNSFGWNNGWNSWGSPYSPWGWNAYSPCPPYGNIIVNNVYYGNNWGWNGGYYGGWNGYNGGGYYNEYTSNVHYGPRKSGGSVTELKGNPRGKYSADFENPRGVTNQGPQNANPGRVRDQKDGVISRPGNVQNPDAPVRPNRPTATEQIPNKPDRIKDKDVVNPQRPDQTVRPERPVIKREQTDNKPFIPKDIDRPARKNDEPLKKDDQIQKPNKGRKNYPDGQTEDEFMFNSKRPSTPNERPTYNESGVENESEAKPNRKERNSFQNTRPQRTENEPRPSVDSRNFNQKVERSTSRNNSGGGFSGGSSGNSSSSSSKSGSSGNSDRKSSNPRGK